LQKRPIILLILLTKDIFSRSLSLPLLITHTFVRARVLLLSPHTLVHRQHIHERRKGHFLSPSLSLSHTHTLACATRARAKKIQRERKRPFSNTHTLVNEQRMCAERRLFFSHTRLFIINESIRVSKVMKFQKIDQGKKGKESEKISCRERERPDVFSRTLTGPFSLWLSHTHTPAHARALFLSHKFIVNESTSVT